MRDDFPEAVKRSCAARAGHICSSPDCGAPTSGPQLRRDKSINLGVAGHITAAAPGGPRFDATLTPEVRASVDNAIWLCSSCAKLVDSDLSRFSVASLHMWKGKAEAAALAVLGKPRRRASGRMRSAEAEIRRNLKLRDRLRKDLLKPLAELRQLPRPHHPYEKFDHGGEVIIRSIADTTYPEADDSPSTGISGWFKLELYDFYHNGLVVILDLQRGLLDSQGHWKLIRHDAHYDSGQFREVRVWRLGRIPWRNIREYDVGGDEYYNIPHLYCDFADDGMPYEDFVHATLGDDYDWPLDKRKRLSDESGAA